MPAWEQPSKFRLLEKKVCTLLVTMFDLTGQNKKLSTHTIVFSAISYYSAKTKKQKACIKRLVDITVSIGIVRVSSSRYC